MPIKFMCYPQSAFYATAFTSEPRDKIIIIIVIIMAVSICFFFYDALARRIAGALTSRIQITSQIIDDVFPANVTERLEADLLATRSGAIKLSSSLTHSQLPKMTSMASGVVPGAPDTSSRHTIESDSRAARVSDLGGSYSGGGDGLGVGRAVSSSSKFQIADFYPNVTVLFSDVVSFTSWSSTVTPEKIFETLEIMFGTFDVREGCVCGGGGSHSCGAHQTDRDCRAGGHRGRFLAAHINGAPLPLFPLPRRS